MSTSHNPVMNRMLPEQVAINQAEVDAQFDKIVSSQKMTVGGVAIKMMGLFALLLGGAVLAWNYDPVKQAMIPAIFVALGLALWITFSKKVRPGAVMAYAVTEGIFLGTVSYFFEVLYPGIVMNAVIGTLATAGVMFTAYSLGWVRVTGKFRSIMLFALIGYGVFSLVNLGVSFVTGSAGIYDSQFAWVAGLIGVGLAAFTLNLDFEDIKQGAAQGLPREFEWRASFGLLVTLIWLYIEILRLLAIFNRD